MSIGEKIIRTTELEAEGKINKLSSKDKPSKKAVSIFKTKAFSYGPGALNVK